MSTMSVLRELRKPEWIIAVGTVILVVLTLALLGVTILLLPDDKLAVLRLYHWPLVTVPVIIVVGMVVASVFNFKAARVKSSAPPTSDRKTEPDATVRDSDPRIEIEFRDERHAITGFIRTEEAYFTPVNRGQHSANYVCFETIRLREHSVSFPTVGYSIATYRSENTRPLASQPKRRRDR